MFAVLKNYLFFFCIFLSLASSAQCADINLWREPPPIVRKGKYQSVIQDRGTLQKAIKASNGKYLFSEKGAGLKPLVLIGTWSDIVQFFAKESRSGIDNQVEILPEIYIGITEHEPKERFKGLFPCEDFFAQLATHLFGIFTSEGGPAEGIATTDTTAAIMGSAEGFAEYVLKPLTGVKNFDDIKKKVEKKIGKDKKKEKVFYVKFSYLPEDDMEVIATHQLAFADLLALIQDNLKEDLSKKQKNKKM